METEISSEKKWFSFEKIPIKKIHASLRIKFTLPITALVLLMFCTLGFYIIIRETNILEKHFFASAKRELIYFQNTAQTAFSSGDESGLLFFMSDLKNNLSYISYAAVIDTNDVIKNCFDKRNELKVGSVLADGIARNIYLPQDAKEKKSQEKKSEIIIHDVLGSEGKIYDISAPVLDNSGKEKFGFVIMGISDFMIRDEIAQTRRQLTGISFVFIIISAIGAFMLSGVTIRPIKKLSEDVAIIGSGNLDYVIDVKRSDEIGILADGFNLMARQIQEAKNNEMKNQLVQDQLDMAKDIQEGLNPMTYYHKGGIQIKGFTRAAQDVGGDYFDYIDIDENRIGVLISDVSGKGVPASLVMIMIRTVFTTYIKRDGSINSADVVRAINDSLSDTLSADFVVDKFATLFFFIYDREKEEISFSNAGHGPLYCFRARGNVFTTTKLDGIPIGITENVKYPQARVCFEPGDVIIMFTDGANETLNINNEQYGLDRIIKMLVEKHDVSADELVKTLVDDIDNFRKTVPPPDDMTVVVFKRDA